MSSQRIPRLGFGGPVGSGKTMLIEQVVPILSSRGYNLGIISNDVVSKEDADRMRRNLATERGLMREDLNWPCNRWLSSHSRTREIHQ